MMNNHRDLIDMVDRVATIVSSHFSPSGESKLLHIDENTTPLELMVNLIDFVFVDQHMLFSHRNMNDRDLDSKFPRTSRLLEEDEKILQFEINDLIVDICYEVIRRYEIYKNEGKLANSYTIEMARQINEKANHYFKTRLHKIQDFLYGPVNDIIEIINNPIEEDKPGAALDELVELADLFKSRIEYLRIMDLLVKEKLCQTYSLQWKDLSRGYKKNCVGIVKHLELKGYYNLKRKLNPNEIQNVISNSFNLRIEIDTIKRVTAQNFASPLFKKIPPSVL